jgi:hypothetical protein
MGGHGYSDYSVDYMKMVAEYRILVFTQGINDPFAIESEIQPIVSKSIMKACLLEYRAENSDESANVDQAANCIIHCTKCLTSTEDPITK